MSEKELGPDFAVHGGGIDLVFPHHENEIAQTEAARDSSPRSGCATAWSSSTREDVEVRRQHLPALRGDRGYGGQTVVAYLGSGHYRQPLAFWTSSSPRPRPGSSGSGTPSATRQTGDADEFLADRREAFLDALADDFSTPQAYAVPVRDRRRRQPARAAGCPRVSWRSFSHCSASTRCSGRRRRPRRRLKSFSPSVWRRGPQGTSIVPIRSATSWPRWAGRSATRPGGARLVRRR